MNEEWRAVKGYEGLYEVSDKGRVRRINGNVLRQWETNWGYKMVQLWKCGKGKHKSVHRLVATAYIPNTKNLPQVNHIDENKTNNCVSNLEWCTARHNINHGTRNANVSKTRTNNPKICKRIAQYTDKGIFMAEYPSLQEAERQTGIKAGSIHYSANSGRKGGGYIWRYSKEAL